MMMPENGNQMAVSLAKIGGRGGAGRWKTSACCGTNEILKRDEYAFHKI